MNTATQKEEKMEERILMMKNPTVQVETGVITHLMAEVEDHQEAVVVEEEVQVDHLPDHSNL